MDELSPQLELYVDTANEQWDTAIQQMFSLAYLTGVVQQTLQQTHIADPVMLTLLITDDTTIQDMNKQYRAQNKPTDVLSFPLLDHPLVQAPKDQLWMLPTEDENANRTAEATTPPFVTPPELITNLGDIVISWPTLLRQALAAGHSPTYELLYLLIHGVLHLIGYDDHTEAGYQAMVSLQQKILQQLGQRA